MIPACLSSIGDPLAPIIPEEANQARVQPTTEPAREHRVVMALQTENCEICRVVIGGSAINVVYLDRLAGHTAHAACAVGAKEDCVRRWSWDLCSRHRLGGRLANWTRTPELWTIGPSHWSGPRYCFVASGPSGRVTALATLRNSVTTWCWPPASVQRLSAIRIHLTFAAERAARTAGAAAKCPLETAAGGRPSDRRQAVPGGRA